MFAACGTRRPGALTRRPDAHVPACRMRRLGARLAPLQCQTLCTVMLSCCTACTPPPCHPHDAAALPRSLGSARLLARLYQSCYRPPDGLPGPALARCLGSVFERRLPRRPGFFGCLTRVPPCVQTPRFSPAFHPLTQRRRLQARCWKAACCIEQKGLPPILTLPTRPACRRGPLLGLPANPRTDRPKRECLAHQACPVAEMLFLTW